MLAGASECGGGTRSTVAVKYYDAARIQRLDSLSSTQDVRNRIKRQLEGLLECSSSSQQQEAAAPQSAHHHQEQQQQHQQHPSPPEQQESPPSCSLSPPDKSNGTNTTTDSNNATTNRGDENEKSVFCSCWDYNFDNIKTFRDSYQHSVIFFVLPPSLLQSQLENMYSIVNLIQRSCQHFTLPSCYCCCASTHHLSNERNNLVVEQQDKNALVPYQQRSVPTTTSTMNSGCAKIFLLPDWNSALHTISSIQESLTASKIQKKEAFFEKESQRMLFPMLAVAAQEQQEEVMTHALLSSSGNVQLDETCVKDVVRKVFRDWAVRRGIDERDAHIVLDVVGSLQTLIIGGRDILNDVPVEESVKGLIRNFFMGIGATDEEKDCNVLEKSNQNEKYYCDVQDGDKIHDGPLLNTSFRTAAVARDHMAGSREQHDRNVQWKNAPQDSNFMVNSNGNSVSRDTNMHGNYNEGFEMYSSGYPTNDNVVIRNQQHHHKNHMMIHDNPNHAGTDVDGICHNGRFELPAARDHYADTLPSRRQNGAYATMTGNCNHYRDGFKMPSGADFEVNTNQPPEISIPYNDYGFYHQPNHFIMDENSMQQTTFGGGTKSYWNAGMGDNNGRYAYPACWEEHEDHGSVDHHYYMNGNHFMQQRHEEEEAHSPFDGGGDHRFRMYPQRGMYQRPTQVLADVNNMNMCHQQPPPSSSTLSPTPTTNKHFNSHHSHRGSGSKRRYLRPAVSAECYRSPRVGSQHSPNFQHSTMPGLYHQHGGTSIATHTQQISGPGPGWQQQSTTHTPSSWQQRTSTPMMPRYQQGQNGIITAPHHGRIIRSPTQRIYTRRPQQERSCTIQQMGQQRTFQEHHGNNNYIVPYDNPVAIAATSEQAHGGYFDPNQNDGNPFDEFSYRGY